MTSNLTRKLAMTRKLAIAVSVLLITSACSNAPTAASRTEAFEPVAAAPSVRLSNLNGTYLGQANKLCDGTDSAMAIDQLSFDYEATGASLAGALLIKCETGNCLSGVPLGTVTSCPTPPSLCDADTRQAMEQGLASACLKGDPASRGSVDVLALTPWEQASTYTVMAFFEETGKRSNTVSTTIGHQAP